MVRFLSRFAKKVSIKNNSLFVHECDIFSISEEAFKFLLDYRGYISRRVIQCAYLNQSLGDIDAYLDFIHRFDFASFLDNSYKANYYELKVYQAIMDFLNTYES